MIKVRRAGLIWICLFWAGGAGFARGGSGRPPAKTGPARPESLKMERAVQAVAKDYRGTVEPVFKAACFNCHSSATRYPWYYRIPGIHGMIDGDIREARKHLDMSGGYPFKGKGNLESDLKAVAYQVAQGKMPPIEYRLMHPESRLTEKQKQAIEDWADRSRDRLDQAGW